MVYPGRNTLMSLTLFIGSLILNLHVSFATPVLSPSFAAQETDASGTKSEADDRQKLWTEVELAVERRRIQTVAPSLAKLSETERKLNHVPESVKASALWVFAETERRQHSLVIQRIEEELQKTPPEGKPVLKLLLANTYQSHLMARLQHPDSKSSRSPMGVEQLSINELYSRIGELYEEVLAESDNLKAASTKDYKTLLVDDPFLVAKAPTLYDFAVLKAIEYFQYRESWSHSPTVRQFSISLMEANQFGNSLLAFETARDELFSPREDFQQVDFSDSEYPADIKRCLALFQDLSRFHNADSHDYTRGWVEMARIRFAVQLGPASNRSEGYRKALERFLRKYPDHVLAAEAAYKLADDHGDNSRPDKWHELLQEFSSRFSGTFFADRGRELLERSTKSNLQLYVPFTLNSNYHLAAVKARNASQLHFRLYSIPLQRYQAVRSRYNARMEISERESLIEQSEAVREWSVSIPEADRKHHQWREVAVPIKGLKSGLYVLSVREDEEDSIAESLLSNTWVTRMGFEHEPSSADDKHRMQLWDSVTHQPLAGAKVTLKILESPASPYKAGTTWELTTDQQGYFYYPTDLHRTVTMWTARSEDQVLAFHIPEVNQRSSGSPVTSSWITTDKHHYRPGEKVLLTGFSFRTLDGVREVLPNQEIDLTFKKVRGTESRQLKLTTNEFGSFHGHFRLPADAEGDFSIRRRWGNEIGISVSDFQTPDIVLQLELPGENPEPNQDFPIGGKAWNAFGEPISNATVYWYAKRQVTFPDVVSRGYLSQPLQLIPTLLASGKTRTDSSGQFQFSMNLKTPEKLDSNSMQTDYSFALVGCVVDASQNIRKFQLEVPLTKSKPAFGIEAECRPWDEPNVRIRLTTPTAGLPPSGGLGHLQVWELEERAPKLDRTEVSRRLEVNREVLRLGPPYNGLTTAHPESLWLSKKGKLASAKRITASDSNPTSVPLQLAPGDYRVQWSIDSGDGQPPVAEAVFTVLAPNSSHPQLEKGQMIWNKDSVKPGEAIRGLVYSTTDKGSDLVRWYHRGKVLKEEWIEGGKGVYPISFVPTQDHLGIVEVAVTMHDEGIQSRTKAFHVGQESPLRIRWLEQTEHSPPNTSNTWRGILEQSDGKPVRGEVAIFIRDSAADPSATNGVINQDWDSLVRSLEPQSTPSSKMHQTSFRSAYIEYGRRPWESGISYGPRPETPLDWASYLQLSVAGNPFGGVGFARPSPGATKEFPLQQFQWVSGSEKRWLPLPSPLREQQYKPIQPTVGYQPSILTDANGAFEFTFSLPEARIDWTLTAIAHDETMRMTYAQEGISTASPVFYSVQNPDPVVVGADVEIVFQVINQTGNTKDCDLTLQLTDLKSGNNIAAPSLQKTMRKTFVLGAHDSSRQSWRFAAPEASRLIRYSINGKFGAQEISRDGVIRILGNSKSEN